MKTRILILIIGLFSTIVSFGQIIDNENNDSIRIDKILKDALEITKKNLLKKNFTTTSITSTDDGSFDESSYNVTVNIIIGHIFAPDKLHVLIRLISTSSTYLYIYKETNNRLELVISRLQDGMTYLDDKIKDVNGDNHKDFLVHWYPESGCCRRNVYNVYLYQPDNGNFTKDYQFINPTFSKKEKIIRGVGYGHPGEVGLYKYKWNGLQIDTLEYIYPNQEDSLNRTFYKTDRFLYSSEKINKEILKTVPQEYKKIESYDWFKEY